MKIFLKSLSIAIILFCGVFCFPQGPSQDSGWQVRLLQIGESYKLHQFASQGTTPFSDWASAQSDWLWITAQFSTFLTDGLNYEDDPYGIYSLGITHSGGVKPIFRWVAGSNNAPAPAFLYVRNIASAISSNPFGTVDGSVNNGLGSPILISEGGSKKSQSGSKVFKLEGVGEIEMPTQML